MRRAACLAAALACLTLAGCEGDSPLAPAEAAEPPEQIAARWLAEENHGAIQVGAVWVTAESRALEPGAAGDDADAGLPFQVTLSVWDPADMDQPIQKMTKKTAGRGCLWTADANFDGRPDLCWRYFLGNQPTYSYLWVWDEAQKQFMEEPEFAEISMPGIDRETEQITGWARSSGAGTGLSTIHQWIDGRLTCVRRIEAEFSAASNYESVLLTVEDRVDGALTEVYRQEFPEGDGSFFAVRTRWEDFTYHGEAENAQES